MEKMRETRMEEMETVRQEVRKIYKDKMREALKRMKNGKEVSHGDITVVVWKFLRDKAVEVLMNQLNMTSWTIRRCLRNGENLYGCRSLRTMLMYRVVAIIVG